MKSACLKRMCPTINSRMRIFLTCTHLRAFFLAGVASLLPFADALAQSTENTGRIQNPLITAEPPVPIEVQEQLGLVAIAANGNPPHCSAVMLSNAWIATAAHCVTNQGDRSRPSTIEVLANWQEGPGVARVGTQRRASSAIYTFWGNRSILQPERPETTFDVALIHLVDPVRIMGWPSGYSRPIDRTGPHDLIGTQVRSFGRGFGEWASFSSTNAPQPAVSDGLWRSGTFSVEAALRHLAATGPEGFVNGLRYDSTTSLSIMGGDSGGPTFRNAPNESAALIGVHALCTQPQCINDPNCTNSVAPNGQLDWSQVMSVEWCADAPLAPVASAIDDIMAQSWDPTLAVQRIEVTHSEGWIEKDLLLGELDGLPWAYVQRAVQKMCVNRGFVAGFASGEYVAVQRYSIVCFSAAAGRWQNVTFSWGGDSAFQDVNAVDWAQANRSAAQMCQGLSVDYPGGFHTGYSTEMNNGIGHAVFCLDATVAAWMDTPAGRLGAASDLSSTAWAAASRAATAHCRANGFAGGGFLNGHESASDRGTVCIRQPLGLGSSSPQGFTRGGSL